MNDSPRNKNLVAAISAAIGAYLQTETYTPATATGAAPPEPQVSFWRILRYMIFNR